MANLLGFWELLSEVFMLEIFMLRHYFFRYLLGFLYNLEGFPSNIKEIKPKLPVKLCRFLWAKRLILKAQTLQRNVNKEPTSASVANKFVLQDFLIGTFFCWQTIEKRKFYNFSGLEKQNRFYIEVQYGNIRELL